MPRRRRSADMGDLVPHPVVLLHGCGGSADETYRKTGWIAQLVASGRAVLPLTLPGHEGGASHDPAAYADLAGSVLKMLPPRVDLVGFSLGGKLSIEIAARAPDRVGRLVVGGVGDNIFAPERSGEASAVALERGIDDQTPPAIVGFYRYCEGGGADLPAIAAVLRRAANPVIDAERLKRIVAPTLLVVGDADPIAFPVAGLAAAVPIARTVVLPGVDHLSLPANLDFQRVAFDFLAGAN